MIISTNILSDYSKEDFRYIVTPSAETVSDEILDSLNKRYRCLTLIGSYGTGKSSFLYALEKSILKNGEYFPRLADHNSLVLKSIGQYESLLVHFGQILKTKPEINSIFKSLKENDKKNKKVYILLDEFGKIIEFSLKNNPKKETYYFQQIAEFINNDLNNTILITTLHQSFESYSYNVGTDDIAEWEKVSGRFFSITFNEPVEIVAQIVLKHFKGIEPLNKRLVEMTRISTNLNLIPQKFALEDLNYGSIGVMDGLTTYIAISLFRKYAQNERSIFSFLNDQSVYGLSSYVNSNFSLPELYDYVLNRFSHVIYSTVNPDKLQWEAAERAIQRADSHDELEPDVSHRILKTIHLINLFAREIGKFDAESIQSYLLNDKPIDFKKGLKLLFEKNIIQYVNYKGRLTFVEGTDVNLDEELKKAAGKLSLNADYDLELKKLVAIEPFVAKQHLFSKGTPRLWFTNIQIDNVTQSDFNDAIRTNGIILISFKNGLNSPHEKFGAPIVHCRSTITNDIKLLIERIRKFEIVIEEYKDDFVVRNLVQLELDFATRELKSIFLKHIYTNGIWTYSEKLLKVKDSRSLNSELSKIFDEFYIQHPVVINELINRAKLSASINTARKRLTEGLLSDGGQLVFEGGKYPPEKMIFDSTLLKECLFNKNSRSIKINPDSSYFQFWKCLESTFEESRYQKRPFADFILLLNQRPFGMKEGLIKFLLSYFIISKKDDFALTHEPTTKFIPYLNIDSIEAMFLRPNEYYIKKYNFDKVPKDAINILLKLSRIQQDIGHERSAFFGIYAQLIRSLNTLPNYTRNTKKGLNPKTLKFREAIERASDPEKALLIDIPISLGFKPLIEQKGSHYMIFYDELENCMNDLASAFPNLIIKFKNLLLDKLGARVSGFSLEKEFLKEIISTINIDVVSNQIKVILKRMLSPLDDEPLYWKAIIDAIAEFNIEGILDEHIEIVNQKIIITTDAVQSLIGMIGTESNNISISVTQSDGNTKRKFSNSMTENEVEHSHKIVMNYLSNLDPQTRLKLLTYFINKEL